MANYGFKHLSYVLLLHRAAHRQESTTVAVLQQSLLSLPPLHHFKFDETWTWLSWFHINTRLLSKLCCRQWGHVRIERWLCMFHLLRLFRLIKCFQIFLFHFLFKLSKFLLEWTVWPQERSSLSDSLMLQLIEILRVLYFSFPWNIWYFSEGGEVGLRVPDSMRVSNPEHSSFQLMECDWGRNLIHEFCVYQICCWPLDLHQHRPKMPSFINTYYRN